METSLVDDASKMVSPVDKNILLFINIKSDTLSESFKLEVDWLSNSILLFSFCSDKLKNQVKMKANFELFVFIMVLNL